MPVPMWGPPLSMLREEVPAPLGSSHRSRGGLPSPQAGSSRSRRLIPLTHLTLLSNAGAILSRVKVRRGGQRMARLRVGIIGTGRKKEKPDVMGFAMAYRHAAGYQA